MMADRTQNPTFDSDDIAARYGFERQITSALARARPVTVTDAMIAEYERLISDCYLMKGTLFNAAKRLERQHAAGQFTFALSGIYGFLVPLFALQFEPFLTALVTNIVSFTAATAGAISFVVAMIYQQRDLGRQARNFHEAGLKMNKLRRNLQGTPLLHPKQLADANHIYDDIFLTCNNHDEIDFEFAKLGPPPRNDKTGALAKWHTSRRRLNVRFAWQAFSTVAAVWVIPPMVGLGIWWSLSSHISTASQIAR